MSALPPPGGGATLSGCNFDLGWLPQIVLAVGRLVRSGLGSPTHRIIFEDMADVTDLVELSEVRLVGWPGRCVFSILQAGSRLIVLVFVHAHGTRCAPCRAFRLCDVASTRGT